MISHVMFLSSLVVFLQHLVNLPNQSHLVLFTFSTAFPLLKLLGILKGVCSIYSILFNFLGLINGQIIGIWLLFQLLRGTDWA